MSDSTQARLAIVAAVAAGLYWLLHRWRFGSFAHMPTPLKRNIFLGHLGYIAAEFQKFGSSGVHPDYVFENIWKENGCPDIMFFDTRPVQHPLALIGSHEVAEQVSKSTKTQPYSTTKSPTIQAGFGRLVGRMSMLSAQGETWKGYRKLFNPGFSPQHLLSVMPVLVDKARIFASKMDGLAKSGAATEMEPYCTNVTFDIISEFVTDIDCKAQDETSELGDIVKYFGILTATYAGENGLVPTWMNIPLHVKRYVLSNRLDAAVKKCILEKWNAIQSGQIKSSKTDRSVLALALRDTEDLTPAVLQSIADQVKTFLFAGHDTTSILLQRLLYAISVHPKSLSKIRAEHDAVFGQSDPGDILLAQPDETIKRLTYTSACIKEALRLWPPAATARMSHNGFTVRTSDGQDYCLDKCVIYSCQHILHRDKRVYGETADDFVPERWLGDVDTSSAMQDADGAETGESKVPISAWRPFERGPRNCIGQELANLEARVILSMVMRKYNFIKVGVGEIETDEKGKPVIDEKGKYKTKSELISTMAITSKPIDKTVMRVALNE